jgi:transposase
MSTLDDIGQERQRLSERLAKIDSERARVAEELAELEAAERVLARLTKERPPTPRRGRPRAVATAPEPAAAAKPRGRRGRRAASKPVTVSLGEATLRAVAAHGQGVTAEGVRQYLASEFGMQVRPNHLGMALQRHRRGGRLAQRELLWFPE